jgi:hypothetical protein
VRAPRAALKTRLLSLGDFLHQQPTEEIAIGPAFLFGLSGEGLVGPARVCQVKTSKQRIELGSREVQTLGRVLIRLCGHRFLPVWYPRIFVRKTSSPGDKLPNLLIHDFRRSAARNLRAAGVAEIVVMQIGGWKTASVFRRYAIVNNRDKFTAMDALEQKRIADKARLEAENSHSFGHSQAVEGAGEAKARTAMVN